MIRLNKRIILRLSDREYNELLEMRGHLFNVWSVTELLRRAITLLRQDYLRQGGPELKGRVMEARASNAASDNPPSMSDTAIAVSDEPHYDSGLVQQQLDRDALADRLVELGAPTAAASVRLRIAEGKAAAAGSAQGPVNPATGMARKAKPARAKPVSDKTPKSADLPKRKGKHA